MSSGKPVLDLGRALTLIVAVAALAWVGSVVLEAFGYAAVDAERTRKQVQVVDPAVEQYRAEQRALLEGYKWIDRENDVVQLPIERAMQLVVDESGAGVRR